jgi:hypothetical protein
MSTNHNTNVGDIELSNLEPSILPADQDQFGQRLHAVRTSPTPSMGSSVTLFDVSTNPTVMTATADDYYIQNQRARNSLSDNGEQETNRLRAPPAASGNAPPTSPSFEPNLRPPPRAYFWGAASSRSVLSGRDQQDAAAVPIYDDDESMTVLEDEPLRHEIPRELWQKDTQFFIVVSVITLVMLMYVLVQVIIARMRVFPA